MTDFEKGLVVVGFFVWFLGYMFIFGDIDNRTTRYLGLLWPLVIPFIILAAIGIGFYKIKTKIKRR